MSACCDDCAKSGGTCGDKKAKPAWSVGGAMARVGIDPDAPQYPTVNEQNAYNQGVHDGQLKAWPTGVLVGGLGTAAIVTGILLLNRGKVLR